MANLYDEKILGTKQKIALAQKLRESGQEMLQGQMIGDRYVPASWTQHLAQGLKQGLGIYGEMKGEEELKNLETQRLKDVIAAKQGLGIPATQQELEAAGTPAQKPSVFSRIGGALGIIDEPKSTPAVPMQQPPVANFETLNPSQQMQSVLGASEVAPEITNSFMTLQKLKSEEAKNKQEALYKGIPQGAVPGKVPGTFEWMKDPSGKSYGDYQIDKSLANARLVDPVEQERLDIMRSQLKLSRDRLDNDIANKAETETPYNPNELAYLGELIKNGVNPSIPRKRMSEVLSYMANSKQDPNEVISGSINIGAQKATEKAYSPAGVQGKSLIALSTAGQHLDLMTNLADALENNDINAINALSQNISSKTGESAPTNFDAARRVVAGEIMKTISATGGGVEERKAMADTLDRANSPAQLKGVISTFQNLLAGKVHGLAGGYESGTGKTFDYKRFKVPSTWIPPTEQPVNKENAPPPDDELARLRAKHNG
jgi:hypothetical protein